MGPKTRQDPPYRPLDDCPLRRIVKRFDKYRWQAWPSGEVRGTFLHFAVKLECGHVLRDVGSRSRMRCRECRRAAT